MATPPGKRRRKRPLILHMDLNKTLLISDPVSGVCMEAMVNAILSECSWGFVSTNDNQSLTPRSWQPLSSVPSSAPPATHPQAITYNEFLETMLRPSKALKKQLKGKFTEAGELGGSLRPYFNLAMKALRVPGEAEAYYAMLPSFFHLVNHLEEAQRDFALVFRTFGTDIPTVAQEFNTFCDGQHPHFTTSCPTRTRHRRLVLPRDSGALHRTSNTDILKDGVNLAMASETNSAHGLQAVYAGIMAHLQPQPEGDNVRRSLALQDDYRFWAANDESDESGKLMVLEEDDDAEEDTPYQVFFDDNLERRCAHIVDARALRTGAPVPYETTRGKHLVKVEPLQAILDLDYFVRALQQAEEET